MPKQWPDILLPSKILIDPLGWSRVGCGLHCPQSSGALRSAVPQARASRGDAAARGWRGNPAAHAACQGCLSLRSLQLLTFERAHKSPRARPVLAPRGGWCSAPRLQEPVWVLLQGIVLGWGAWPGLSLHFGAGAEKEKEDKALFSNCPLQHFWVDRTDFFFFFLLLQVYVRKRQPGYDSILNN